jgi:two-component system, OmpR family, phosphate regulon sensor histidine kinase PhoR
LKILKPKRLALLTAILIASVAASVTGFVLYFNNDQDFLIIPLAIAFLLSLAGYLIISFALDKYFYNNVRIIYKNILQLRSSSIPVPGKNITDEKVLSEINRILIEWEKGNKEEIGHLKELEHYRKEFLGNVSHELKTPIFTIQGYIHTLIDGGIEDQDINMLYLQKAARGIDRLSSIVDDLESISKLEAGELILEHRTFDIVELVTDVFESLELQAHENEILLVMKDGQAKPCYVYADKERIRQVLVNLIENSIKYGKKSGRTEVSIEDDVDKFIIQISDNGIGIEKSHLPRLFERFYRVDKSRSREQGGTGLGLAIVKHIIEAHGEKINVASTSGFNTTFSFTLKKSK